MKDGKCSIESLFAIKMYAHFAQLSHSIFSKTAISRETTSVWWMKQSIKTGTMDIAQKFQLSLIVENFGLCKYVSRSTHISTTWKWSFSYLPWNNRLLEKYFHAFLNEYEYDKMTSVNTAFNVSWELLDVAIVSKTQMKALSGPLIRTLGLRASLVMHYQHNSNEAVRLMTIIFVLSLFVVIKFCFHLYFLNSNVKWCPLLLLE